MASHDLSNMKATIVGATPGAIPGIDGNPHEIFSFAPSFSERFFKDWGGPRAPDFRIIDVHATKRGRPRRKVCFTMVWLWGKHFSPGVRGLDVRSTIRPKRFKFMLCLIP